MRPRPLLLRRSTASAPRPQWRSRCRSRNYHRRLRRKGCGREMIHAREKGDALRLGVILRATPPLPRPLLGPLIGTTKISPPVTPASLIRPSMRATFFPSGETCGSSICHLGSVDLAHLAALRVDAIEPRDPPIGVAGAVRRRGCPRRSVGSPVVFIDVHVGRRDLRQVVRAQVDGGEALLVDLVVNHSRRVGSSVAVGQPRGEGP